MFIERKNNEVVIRLPSFVPACTDVSAGRNTEGVQELIDYLVYKEATSRSKAKQQDADRLAKEVKKGWWAKNRKRLLK